MKLLKILGLVILAIVLGSYLLPSSWRVERSIVINAPPDKIYFYLADLQRGWTQWSAFDFEDPNIQYSYTGPDIGVGASRSWTSEKMGNGSQTITMADPSQGVEFELKMDTGFVVNGRFTLERVEGGTKIVWVDWGEVGMNPFFRWMSFFMDKFLGPTFEKSLAELKKKAESN